MGADSPLFKDQTLGTITSRIAPAKNLNEQAELMVLLLQEIAFFKLNPKCEELAQNVILRLGDTKAHVTVRDVIDAWMNKSELEKFAQAVEQACL